LTIYVDVNPKRGFGVHFSKAANMNDSLHHETHSPWVESLTIGEVLRQTASRYPTQTAMVFSQLDWRVHWSELDAQVDRIARALLGLGFKRGDHFGVWATNVPEWVLLQFATARIGVVLVTINPSYRTSELAFVIGQADLRGIALIDRFKTSDYFASIAKAIPELAQCEPGHLHCPAYPKLECVISLRGDGLAGAIRWDDFLASSTSVSLEQLHHVERQLGPEDPINIQYTSGTTGVPKGTTLSHRNILLNAYYAGLCQRFGSQDKLCVPVPLYHCFGCVLGTLCSIVHGTSMIFPSEVFQAGLTLQAIEQEQCTAIYGVPTMFISMLEHPEYPQRELASLRTGIMAGSPCPIELMKRVTIEMGASQMTIGYGQTEASPLITQTRVDDSLELRVGTVGRVLPGVEAKIIDPETGCELPDMHSGELCSRGHNVMIGYYNLPDRTASAIDRDGWLHTGDLAMREPNGYFRITGRLKDLVIRGGENIFPREIEELLYQHPAIRDVQVIGVPDRKFGEEVMAWVSLRDGQSATEEELKAFCKSKLSYYKVPHYWKFVDSFPTTVTGKIQKFKMREISIQELGLQDVANIETA
jgi:fatty-acyl-CoA synthase